MKYQYVRFVILGNPGTGHPPAERTDAFRRTTGRRGRLVFDTAFDTNTNHASPVPTRAPAQYLDVRSIFLSVRRVRVFVFKIVKHEPRARSEPDWKRRGRGVTRGVGCSDYVIVGITPPNVRPKPVVQRITQIAERQNLLVFHE